jgi:hypothetical protein
VNTLDKARGGCFEVIAENLLEIDDRFASQPSWAVADLIELAAERFRSK